jgi:hypothetical protein
MTAFISIALLGVCVLLLVAHFGEIKKSHHNNG